MSVRRQCANEEEKGVFSSPLKPRNWGKSPREQPALASVGNTKEKVGALRRRWSLSRADLASLRDGLLEVPAVSPQYQAVAFPPNRAILAASQQQCTRGAFSEGSPGISIPIP